MRAARELEDLRQEKESLQVMKQQLAAVHQLRIDLQRKDSVIQAREQENHHIVVDCTITDRCCLLWVLM